MRKIFDKIQNVQYTAKNLFASKSKFKLQSPTKPDGTVIISCKHSHLDHYSVHSNKFDAVPLASKGWKHSKAVGDYFIVHPFKENCNNTYTFGQLGLHPNIINTLSTEKINEATEFQFRANQAVQTGNYISEFKYGMGVNSATVLHIK